MAAKYKLVIFDMDGTLVDSIELINQSLLYAAKECGLPQPDQEMQRAFIGPPLYKSFSQFYGLTGTALEEAIAAYRAYYLPRKTQSPLYPQIKEVLSKLQAAGVKMAIASAKFEPVVQEIAQHLKISQYFTVIGGTLENPNSLTDRNAENDPKERRNKAGVVAYVLQKMGISPEDACLVGDRADDYRGAKINGIMAIGVAWGAGRADEFPGSAWVETKAELLAELGIIDPKEKKDTGKKDETMSDCPQREKKTDQQTDPIRENLKSVAVLNDRNPRDPEALVRQFHEVYSMPISHDQPTVDIERIDMRMNLILEETAELVGAVYGPQAREKMEALSKELPDQGTRDTVEAADALADLIYVIYGMALECGISLPAVLKEVQASNLSKLGADGKPIYREDGKVLKGPGFFPPNVARGLQQRLD